MKEVKAIVQPFMLTKVVDALKKIEGLPGLAVDSDVGGFGRNRAAQARYKIVEEAVEYAPKAKLEIAVSDELTELVVETIKKNAHTGNPGGGKIFIIDVLDVVKIHTNERGENAL
ncbi:MAG: P-II family nitrogen regulator [bacterium]